MTRCPDPIDDFEVSFLIADDFETTGDLVAGPWFNREAAIPWWICDSGALVCEEHAHDVPRREREPLDPDLAALLEEHELGDLLICGWCDDAEQRNTEIVNAMVRALADEFAERAA